MEINYKVDKVFLEDYKQILEHESFKNRGFKMTYKDIFNELVSNYHIEFVYQVLGREYCEVFGAKIKFNKKTKRYDIKTGGYVIMSIDEYTFNKLKGATLFQVEDRK